MDKSDFAKLLSQLAMLSKAQCTQLRHALEHISTHALPVNLDSAIPAPRGCPHCQASAEQLRPWGRRHGLARLRCHSCGKTSNALTGTPLARLRKREQWLSYGQSLVDGVSVRKAAQYCGVANSTTFRWRHRFLQATASHQALHESGIVEADETFFLESYKGQRHLYRPPRKRGGVGHAWEHIAVLVVRDRSGQTADFRLAQCDTTHIAAVLQPLVDKDAILCTDGANVYQAVAHTLGLTHRAVNVSKGIRVVDKVFHIQNVNAYDSRLKTWIQRFHGVASKYLENYLGWRRMLERYQQSIQPGSCLREAVGRFDSQPLMRT